jgi:hypothetical protein
MKLTQSEIEQDVAGIRATAGELPPPSVLTSLLALTRGKADHAIALYESSEGGTTWQVVATAGHSLVIVDASSPRSAWTIDHPSDSEVLADDERLDAQLRRLSDVAAVQVVRTTQIVTSLEWSFNGQWRLTLRDGTPVDIRAGKRTNSAREACDEFALHVIEAIAST